MLVASRSFMQRFIVDLYLRESNIFQGKSEITATLTASE